MAISYTVACLGYACNAAATAAEALGAELIRASHKVFPDGEPYVRLDEAPRGVALAVFTGYPEPPRSLVEGMLLAEALRGAGAAGVIAAPLYLPFSRQDRRFLRGEALSVRAALRALASSGADAVAVVDAHKAEELAWFPGPAADIDPSPLFAGELRSMLSGEEVRVIAPDRGALGRAKRLGEELGAPFDHLEKRRDRVTGEIALRPKSLDVRGAAVVIVDDIVSTGGTLAKAASMLLAQGASRVLAAVTHCLLVGDAVKKLRSSGLEALICANTVEPRWATRIVDVGPLLAEAARELAEKTYGYEAEA